MKIRDFDEANSEAIEAEVTSELAEEKEFAKTLSLEDIKSGQWFIALLQKVVESYDQNARAAYFQQKCPGLHPDEVADKLTSVTVRYATIAGAITGAATTVNVIATIGSAGMTTALVVGALGTEMLYLARIQMRLVLDLAVVYDLQLDLEDPEDVLMIFGYAIGIAPAEMVGQGLKVAAGATTKYAVKKHISKGTLKAIQDFGRRIGFKILQRTILKYTVPVASAAIGSSYNYITTKSVGKIAKSHLKNRGKVTDEIRQLISRQNTYTIAFPAAAMYMAQVDGHYSSKEQELYRALLTRMSFDDHDQAEFKKLIANEESILDGISTIDDEEIRASLVEVLVLMAIYDGQLAEAERRFLTEVTERLNVSLDFDEVERGVDEYRIVIKKSISQQTADAISVTGTKVTDAFKSIFRRKQNGKTSTNGTTVTCENCGNETTSEHDFCPSCGQRIIAENRCVSCNEVIFLDFTFCPSCGSSQ